jgi:hypothetical protein
MSGLTLYLQQEFTRNCPSGWSCWKEQRVLSPEIEALLGYAPRADIMLERQDGSRRLWIEFEVSRADPVANHAKFATAHLFQPQQEVDAFLSMVSSDVARGRRNLAANAISLMRHIGMRAFQTVLLPHTSPAEIRRLNHLDVASLAQEEISAQDEIERALSISEAVLRGSTQHLHFAGDLWNVMLNIRQWNEEVGTPEDNRLWGKRVITYFVFDPYSGSFAPSKFCAYMVSPPTQSPSSALGDKSILPTDITKMTVETYATLDGTDTRFDGARARTHLMRNLAMVPRTPKEIPKVGVLFSRWLSRHINSIILHPEGPVFLIPPVWFK